MKQSPRIFFSHRAFTLIELLLVIGIIAILASIVIIAINPTKQLGASKNAQRRSDVRTVLDALYQYSIQNNGAFPWGGISPTLSTEICDKDGFDQGGLTTCVNLNALTVGQNYLVGIPRDPSLQPTDTGTRYFVEENLNKRITVSAPSAEEGATISISR